MNRGAGSPLVQLVLERAREFWREPGILFWTFGFPILLAIVLGVAFSRGAEERLPVAVVARAAHDASRMPDAGARAVLEALRTDDRLAAEAFDDADAAAALSRGSVLVVVHADATDDTDGTDGAAATRDLPRAIRFVFDPARPDSRRAAEITRDVLERSAGRRDLLAVAEETITARGQRYIDFLLPGLVGFTMMNGGVWMVGYGLIQMRTRKLLKRLSATPMRRGDFLLSFVLVRLALSFVEAGVLFLFGRIAFGIDAFARAPSLVIVVALASFAFSGLGLLTGSRAQNPQTGAGWVNVATMPMMLVSGVFFSPDKFPDWSQPLIQALPLTALNDALRAFVNDGASVASQAHELAILGAWGGVCFAVALRVFRWT